MSSSTPETFPAHDYAFPDRKLKGELKVSTKKPLVLVACGSFSPITYLHLRMFEMASDYVRLHTDFEVVGCYVSPVSDAYKKKGLVSAQHRYEAHPSRSCRRRLTGAKSDHVLDGARAQPSPPG